MEFVDYKCLESLLIEGEELIATEGLFSKLISKFKKSNNNNNKSIDYSKMSNKELATEMVSRLKASGVKLANKSDEYVSRPLELTKIVSENYEEYNINNVTVAVSNVAGKETDFIVYAYIKGMNNGKACCISTKKGDLIKSFIKEDKK